MKKSSIVITTIFLLLAIGHLQFSYAQFITGNADGKGTIPMPIKGTIMGFDAGKTELNIGINNYGRIFKAKSDSLKDNWWFGSNLSVKNASGMGQLFSSGDIVASSDFNILIGNSVSNIAKVRSAIINNNCQINKQKLEEILKQQTLLWRDEFREFWVKYSNQFILEDSLTSKVLIDSNHLNSTFILCCKLPTFNSKKISDSISSWLPQIGATIGLSVPEFRRRIKKLLIDNNIEESSSKYASIELAMKDASEKSKKFKADEVKELEKFKVGDCIDSSGKVPVFFRFTPFLIGGINARNFYWFKGLDQVTLANSFKDTLYRGGFFGIGANVQYGRSWLGATFNWQSGDNYQTLSSKEYILKTTNSSGNSTLTSEKKITAVSGNYGDVRYKQLNIDYLYLIKINDTSRLVVNPYMRATLGSRDTSLLKNITNIGFAIHALGNKGKFIGGIYVELPDVNNNIQKSKPIDERNIRPPFRKLTVGIMARFSFSSILGFMDRPATPSQ